MVQSQNFCWKPDVTEFEFCFKKIRDMKRDKGKIKWKNKRKYETVGVL